jgi:hypothetical protein
MITGRLSHDQADNRPDQFMLIHFDYEKQKRLAFSRREACKFINIRDPRDIAVSAVFWFWDTPNPASRGGEMVPIDQSLYSAWKRADFSGKLSIILESNEYPFGYINRNFREAMKLSSRCDTFINRYEDLVGEQGGGSKELQKKTMLKINRALNLPPLTREQIAFLQDNLYGYSPTFDGGRIGKDQGTFQTRHEWLLQKNLHEELRHFGY